MIKLEFFQLLSYFARLMIIIQSIATNKNKKKLMIIILTRKNSLI